jgi:hypothetical protein
LGEEAYLHENGVIHRLHYAGGHSMIDQNESEAVDDMITKQSSPTGAPPFWTFVKRNRISFSSRSDPIATTTTTTTQPPIVVVVQGNVASAIGGHFWTGVLPLSLLADRRLHIPIFPKR